MVGPRLYFSPLINGIRKDSILSISVINKVLPKRIANSIFVKIFSSCNDITSNCVVFLAIVSLNHFDALLTGSINNTDTYQGDASSQSQIEQQLPADEAPDINNPDNPNNEADVEHVDVEPTQSFMETIKEGFNDFKTNLESNETFRTVTICVSSVVGIALLYVVFLIIRKIWHVIKN